MVIPDVETEGRNALLLSKDSRQSAGYIYEVGFIYVLVSVEYVLWRFLWIYIT